MTDSPTSKEGTDWCWCYENPREAAGEIDRLQREIAGANATIAHFMGPDGEKHIDRFAALIADEPKAPTDVLAAAERIDNEIRIHDDDRDSHRAFTADLRTLIAHARASQPPNADLVLARSCITNLINAVDRFGSVDADIGFAMREAKQFMGGLYAGPSGVKGSGDEGKDFGPAPLRPETKSDPTRWEGPSHTCSDNKTHIGSKERCDRCNTRIGAGIPPDGAPSMPSLPVETRAPQETRAVEIRVADGVAAAVASFVTECDHGVSLDETCEQCRQGR